METPSFMSRWEGARGRTARLEEVAEEDNLADEEEVGGEEGRMEECQTVLAEAVADGVQDADEDAEQAGWDELVLLSEDRDEQRDDLGQEGNVLRLEEVEVAQGVERQNGRPRHGDSTRGKSKSGVHVRNDADKGELVEFRTLVVSPLRDGDIQNDAHLLASALIERL